MGETTDIVEKEMFTFEDQGGRSITLRPEGTASVCRAYVEHGMQKWPLPVKLWYWGPFFRYEAPQAGRFRQFTQIGAEALGSDDPGLDAELILLLLDLAQSAGVRELQLRVSSLGTPETRREYSDELREYLRAREGELSDDVRARIDRNPLRAFDSDHPGTQQVVAGAPRLLDRLNDEDREHFDEVRALLDAAGASYEVDGTLVRGLDYYTRTVFEVTSGVLGAQSAIGGGGRYDRLVEQLGGPPTPGVGWAAGVERILLASGARAAGGRLLTCTSRRSTAAAPTPSSSRGRCGRTAAWSRSSRPGRSAKGQLKHADRLGARLVVKLTTSGVRCATCRAARSAWSAGQEEAVRVVNDWL